MLEPREKGEEGEAAGLKLNSASAEGGWGEGEGNETFLEMEQEVAVACWQLNLCFQSVLGPGSGPWSVGLLLVLQWFLDCDPAKMLILVGLKIAVYEVGEKSSPSTNS